MSVEFRCVGVLVRSKDDLVMSDLESVRSLHCTHSPECEKVDRFAVNQ